MRGSEREKDRETDREASLGWSTVTSPTGSMAQWASQFQSHQSDCLIIPWSGVIINVHSHRKPKKGTRFLDGKLYR